MSDPKLSLEAQSILKFLTAHCKGRANAVKREFLSGQMRFNVRRVRLACEELRAHGEAVLYSTDSDNGGIFLAATEKEIEEGLVKLENLAMSILMEKAALRKALERMRESKVQPKLFADFSGQSVKQWI